MNISLSAEMEAFIKSKIEDGTCTTVDEVIDRALHALRVYEHQLDDLRKDVQSGIDQLDRGEGIPFDDAAMERIKARGRSRLEAWHLQQRRASA